MYGIAIHDRAARQVVLARDPFGIKPLYIAEIPGGFNAESGGRIGESYG
jgi:asparagine synthase (glutamine-hydrolysing)